VAALTTLGVTGGALIVGGTVAQLSSDAQTTGTTVAIIGAVAVVLVAVIGVVGNYLSNRRTAPSPPGVEPDLLTAHDRLTVLESHMRDMRHRLNNIDARVAPLQAILDVNLTEIRRRLDRLEDRT
jgi:hypothetical protein